MAFTTADPMTPASSQHPSSPLRVHRVFLLVCAILFALPSVTRTQEKEVLNTNPKPERYIAPSSRHYPGPPNPRPNVELPPQVPVVPGKLIVYADYAAADDKGVPLYIVNRADGQPLPGFGEERSLELQYQKPDGTWARAQAAPGPGWCGTSNASIDLPAGQYSRFLGYRPKSGVKAKVRYKYGVWASSNEAEGFVSPQDITDAATDFSTIGFLPELLTMYLGPLWNPTLRIPAGPDATWLLAMRMIQHHGDYPGLQPLLEASLETWDTHPSDIPWQLSKPIPPHRSATEIRRILAQPISGTPSVSTLLAFCQGLLQGKTEPADPQLSPAETRAFVWQVLGDLARRYQSGTAEEIATWKELISSIDSVLPSGTNDELRGINYILAATSLMQEAAPDSTLQRWLLIPNSPVAARCIELLNERKSWALLLETCPKLSIELQAAILVQMEATDRTRLWHLEKAHRILFSLGSHWQRLLQEDMAATVRAHEKEKSHIRPFRTRWDGTLPPAFGPSPLMGEIAKILEAEARRSESSPDGYELGARGAALRAAIEFFLPITKEDVELFRRLQNHGGYEWQPSGNPKSPITGFRTYPLRERAQSYFKNRIEIDEKVLLMKESVRKN